MSFEELLNSNNADLGAALHRRAAMQAMHRHDPSTATSEWLDDARRTVRNLQAQHRRLEHARYRTYYKPQRSSSSRGTTRLKKLGAPPRLERMIMQTEHKGRTLEWWRVADRFVVRIDHKDMCSFSAAVLSDAVDQYKGDDAALLRLGLSTLSHAESDQMLNAFFSAAASTPTRT